MKKLFLTLFTIGLLTFGCQEQSSLVEPLDNTNDMSLSKKPVRLMDISADDILVTDSTPDVVALDYNAYYSKKLTINGSKGGRVSVWYTWPHSSKSCNAQLSVPKGAFTGVKEFNIVINIEDLSVSLEPTPFSFDKPVQLSLHFNGIDVNSYNVDTSTFNYLDPLGMNESVSYQSLSVGSNYLWVENAELHHFSRYGFVK